MKFRYGRAAKEDLVAAVAYYDGQATSTARRKFAPHWRRARKRTSGG